MVALISQINCFGKQKSWNESVNGCYVLSPTNACITCKIKSDKKRFPTLLLQNVGYCCFLFCLHCWIVNCLDNWVMWLPVSCDWLVMGNTPAMGIPSHVRHVTTSYYGANLGQNQAALACSLQFLCCIGYCWRKLMLWLRSFSCTAFL